MINASAGQYFSREKKMKEMEQEKEDRRQAKWWTKAEAEKYKVGGSISQGNRRPKRRVTFLHILTRSFNHLFSPIHVFRSFLC